MSRLALSILPIKRKLQSKWKSLRFNLSASNNPLFLGFYKYFYNPKEGSLSGFLNSYSLSKKQEGFTVIQIGANDGITHDPIHKFIKRDNWKGVLLEPQSFVFNQFLKKIYSKNKGIVTLCAAIGEEDGSLPIYKIAFSDMRWATGLTSFSKEKIEDAFQNGIVEINCSKFGIEIPQDKSKWISEEEVDVISPKTLLEKYNLSKIDLLQIDAEGYDLEVIRIFDIPNTQPEAIIFENVGLAESDYQNYLSHLQEMGYNTRKFGPNTLALKKSYSQFQKYFA
ncbi:methyltransferase, FkbM family [Belliella baltica DSM 15883]|uniref:Methyltransferase, FkbM family n=1 Tax=Belliella baltica (strain DSM 15883 / CIP 108006 / LMG 21964 / BA134) TaxID=866536 RepID=I3Z4G0_BELBD|nr:FkbM family methyltransferase [Belliella baltica]AFL84128.1 methyltransferase, FkbM family [Belliella baltica DSM 15883]